MRCKPGFISTKNRRMQTRGPSVLSGECFEGVAVRVVNDLLPSLRVVQARNIAFAPGSLDASSVEPSVRPLKSRECLNMVIGCGVGLSLCER